MITIQDNNPHFFRVTLSDWSGECPPMDVILEVRENCISVVPADQTEETGYVAVENDRGALTCYAWKHQSILEDGNPVKTAVFGTYTPFKEETK